MIFQHYLERLLRRGRNPSTIKAFINAAATFETYLALNGLDVKTIDAEGMEVYFASLPYAVTTKRLHLAHIRAAYRYALARGLVRIDPTVDVELPKLVQKTVNVLSSDRLRLARDSCYSERQWMMFHLFAYTGCRRNEIRELRWVDVSLEANTLRVMGKGSVERLVPIHPALAEVLVEERQQPSRAIFANPYGDPLSFQSLHKTLSTFTDATFHDFRRTVASSLDANGVDEVVIMKILGWSGRTIFDRHYRHVAGDRLQEGILQLYRNDPL